MVFLDAMIGWSYENFLLIDVMENGYGLDDDVGMGKPFIWSSLNQKIATSVVACYLSWCF